LFFIQFFFIILYELNFLTLIIGYSDWDLYKKVLLYGYNRDGFIAILNGLHNIFGSSALYVWYFTQILVNSFLLSKLLSILYYKKRSLVYFILLNPFFIIFYSGIFKEVILLNGVIWATYSYSYVKKFIAISLFGLIRIHLAPFIIFIFTKFNFFIYLIFSILALFSISYLNVIDYSLINGSVSEIKSINKSDFPILILREFSIFPLLLNTLIILFGFLFITKISIKILYLFSILYFFVIFIKEKLFKQFVAFILGLLPYSFILTNAGTALRVITFLFVTTISHYYILNDLKFKKLKFEK
jgi:hypothetical protein